MIYWTPTGSINALKLRALVLEKIRSFFQEKKILEVETPLLCPHTVTDPYIQSLALASKNYYLQTSPEYAMKRLLASGSGCIYQICKAFRDEERGRRHNTEFTMLEWYRVGFDHHTLMDEMDELLQRILATSPAIRMTYREIFKMHLDIDLARVSIQELKQCAMDHKIQLGDEPLDVDTWLDILMSHIIEPKLGNESPCFIYDYPASQSALAKVRQDDYPVAERFEVYFKGIELANGFHELTDPVEQEKRFKNNQLIREKMGAEAIEIDHYFLAALQSGLPDCAGVALGLDRLVMLAAGVDDISEVIAFAIENGKISR